MRLLPLCVFVFSPVALAHAQSYPTKTSRLVVAGAPGGRTDIVGRMVAVKLAESLGQPVVVDPRGAMVGSVGTDVVARAAPDGHTILIAASSHSMNPALLKSLPYDTLKDF